MTILAEATGLLKRALDLGGVRLRFLFVGGVNTCVGLSIFPILILALRPLHLSYMVPLVLSYPISITFSYVTTKIFTFRTRGNYFSEFWRFASFYVVNFAINLAILPICVEFFHLPPIPVQVCFSVAVVALSYLWHSRITFKPRELVKMRNTDFLQRNCPSCGAEPPANAEVSSKEKAEQKSYSDLTPHWNGFFKEKVFFSYVRCPNCALLYNSTFFNQEELGNLYAQMVPNMSVVPSDVLRATQRGYFKTLKATAKFEHGYLEIGPDVGLFTECCVQAGGFDRYWLFEPNRDVAPALSATMANHDFSIIHDMFDLGAVPDGSIGVAVMIHVLDHLLDPMESLRDIRKKLVPGGQILIVTHDESSLLRSIFRTMWPPFCLQHPQLYNPKSMKRLLQAAGYHDATLVRTVNYFPISFLLKQLLWAVGLKAQNTPSFGGASVGLKLGNMMALARA